jgi:hypothetical protein
MSAYSIFELKCPECGMRYAQMIADKEEHLPLPCPSCRTELEKVRKLSGTEMLACGLNVGGG